MKYEIFTASDPEELAKQVNQALDKGWELYGELSVVPFASPSDKETPYHYCIFSQVMVKKEKPEFQYA